MKKIESLYLHFPFCKHLCNYCDFFKKVPQNREQDLAGFHLYLEQAFVEHQKLIEKYGYSWAPLKTLYIGGGTPSLWGKEGKIFLESFLHRHQIILDKQCEFTLEVNPGSWTPEILKDWEELGVNRYSLGIQSLRPEFIKNLDRVHSIEDVYETLEYFKSQKANFSVDFMLGLPFSNENKRDVIAELNLALAYKPNHFSVYILTVKNNYTHFHQLPSEEWIEDEYLKVAQHLLSRGYSHYEVSNFSLIGKESKHNLNYWNSLTVAALGPSATGFLAEDKTRYKWKPHSPVLELETLSDTEFNLEKIYMSLRSREGLDLKILSSSSDLIDLFVNRWIQSGYATLENDKKIILTSKGFLILDSLMDEFFRLKLI